MTASDPAATLATLRAQQAEHPLSILALAEPITAPKSQAESHNNTRPSDASTSTTESNTPLTPATLAADLTHYRELFAKLRFSYLEQVTKEKYLRSIVGDPPLVVSHTDNLALEERLVDMKAALKAKKNEVDELVQSMAETARTLAGRYESVNAAFGVLERVPGEIDSLKREVENLQAEIAHRRGDDNNNNDDDDASRKQDPRMSLPLAATVQALEEQRRANADIDAQIEALRRDMPGKVRQVEKMERELAELEKRRSESARAAMEVRRRRELGGRDEMEDLGKWYRASEGVLRNVLGVEG